MRNLIDILASHSRYKVAETIRAKLAGVCPQLLIFFQFPDTVEIANSFRSMWAAKGDCAVRTVIDTAKISDQTPFQTITKTLA